MAVLKRSPATSVLEVKGWGRGVGGGGKGMVKVHA